MNKIKYQITDEEKVIHGKKVKRIRAAKKFTLPSGKRIEKGTLGGWIESESNLSQEGNCWVEDNAVVCDAASVSGDACISDNAYIHDAATVTERASVREQAEIKGNASVSGYADVRGFAVVSENAQIKDGSVKGHAVVQGETEVCRNSSIEGWAFLTGKTMVTAAFIFGRKTLIDNSVLEGPCNISGRVINSRLNGYIKTDEEANITDSVLEGDFKIERADIRRTELKIKMIPHATLYRFYITGIVESGIFMQ